MSGSQNGSQNSPQKKTYLVELHLVSNTKAARYKPFVAKLEGNELKFLRAIIPRYRGGSRGGKYLLEEGAVYIIRRDHSSHKHARVTYALEKMENGKLRKLAEIFVEDGSPYFEPESLEEIFVEVVSKGVSKNKYVQTLLEYARRRGLA